MVKGAQAQAPLLLRPRLLVTLLLLPLLLPLPAAQPQA